MAESEPGADGGVFYVVEDPSRTNDVDGGPHVITYLHQPFARDGPKHRTNATPEEIAQNRANIWWWDGNREAPTLSPSYLLPAGPGTKYPDLPRVHLFLRAGKIELLSDSSVTTQR